MTGKVLLTVRFLLCSTLPSLIISEDQIISFKHHAKHAGAHCDRDDQCKNSDCRGGRCGGRAWGSRCENNKQCSSMKCFKNKCLNDAIMPNGKECSFRRECISRICKKGKCVGRENGELCEENEWCDSGHCNNSKCADVPVDPCGLITSEKKCLNDCAWSFGKCSGSLTKIWCGDHQAPSCRLCPDGKGAAQCNGDCNWYSRLNECIHITKMSFRVNVNGGEFCDRDFWTNSDPFASVKLKKHNDVVKDLGHTSTASDSQYPVWNFSKDLGEYTKIEFENLQIYFEVRDEDTIDNHDLLGMGSMSMEFTPGEKKYNFRLHDLPHEKGCKSESWIYFSVTGTPV